MVEFHSTISSLGITGIHSASALAYRNRWFVSVIPAKAGISCTTMIFPFFLHGIPAFAGMTNEGFSYVGLPFLWIGKKERK